MLWYKTWLETRARFLTSLLTMVIFSSVFVHHAIYISCMNTLPCPDQFRRSQWVPEFHRLLFINQQFVVIMWILAVVLLGMGGIVREKALGTSSLTLALPVSRARVMSVRIALGTLQAIALGVASWLAVYIISARAGMPVSLSQVAFYVVLLVAGGLVYLAMSVFVSTLVAGEYTAPAIAFGVVLVAAVLFDAWLRRFNLWRLVTGDFSIDRNTYLLPAHLPLLGISASLAVAVLIFFASVLLIKKRDF